MTFQSAPEVAEAVIQGEAGGVNLANVLNFWLPGGYNQSNIDDLAAAVDVDAGSGYRPLLHGSCSYVATLVRGLESTIDLTAVAATGAGIGSASGDALPNNVSSCATLRTGFTGRSARGRFFAFPTGSGNVISDNVLATSYGTALVSFLNDIKADALAAGWHLVVLSRRNAGVIRPVATHLDVTNIAMRNLIVDSQRHRLPRGH